MLASARIALAAPPTPGFPEPVVQWGVQKGETCEDIAKALYGSPKHAALIQRYNRVACKANAPLVEGTTLVLPEKPTTLPDAKLRSLNPDVRARPGGGGWSPASTGMPLYSNYNVNTLDKGRADVEFIDRTRVFLAPNTLVVIYGTASQTRVSKTPPPAVEVEAGEVKAGLSALRGDSVEVAIKGGGRVSAASRDTVVQRKADRTTVAVFDGKAGVTSGGRSVEVPKNFGTRFYGVKPPAPPRPLPPAPVWSIGVNGRETVMLAPGGTGTINVAWSAVPVAIAYRFEIARDREFHDLVAREEVPANITAFRGEKLPVGTYYVAVRAIDKEEYLGIAAETREVRLVDARLESGRGQLQPSEIEANPYGILRLGAAPDLEASIDEGPFSAMPDEIDLRKRAPKSLRLRPRGSSSVDVVTLRYTKVGATVDPMPSADARTLSVKATLTGLEGVDIEKRVAPSGRARLPSGVRSFALARQADGSFLGSLDLSAEKAPIERVRIDVVDDRGAVLGTKDWAPAPKPSDDGKSAAPPQIGAYAPIWVISPSADVLWLAPAPPDGAAISTGLARGNAGWTVQGQVRASGTIGPLGLDAALRTDTADATTASGSAWLGARVRVLKLAGSKLELAPAFRVGLPIAALGAPVRVEPAVAIGGVAGRFTWLADVGARVRAASDAGGTGTPVAQGFLIAGATYDPLAWMRLHAAIDAHLVGRDGGAKDGLAGFAAGIEMGRAIYGGLALHLAPWSDPGLGPFTAQLSVGFRGAP